MLTILWNQVFIRPAAPGGGSYSTNWQSRTIEESMRLDAHEALLNKDQQDMLEIVAIIALNLL